MTEWKRGQLLLVADNPWVWPHSFWAWDDKFGSTLREAVPDWIYRKMIKQDEEERALLNHLCNQHVEYVARVKSPNDKGEVIDSDVVFAPHLDRYFCMCRSDMSGHAHSGGYLSVPDEFACPNCSRTRSGSSVCWWCGQP